MLMLDLDLTGLPCGKKCESATKGDQGEEGIRWGRQLGRVIAAQYEEVVIDRLYPGNLHLTQALRPLVEDLEQTLALDEEKRKRTIIRLDAGGGSIDAVNWLLERGYQIHGKDICCGNDVRLPAPGCRARPGSRSSPRPIVFELAKHSFYAPGSLESLRESIL